jgi:Anti-sigma-K factor rskA/Putative zinc-finger
VSVEGSQIDPELCGDNVAPYVLGALTEREHEAFRRHLDSCAVCREEVVALQVVANALPVAAPQLSAPAELKQRVMASVNEDLGRVKDLGRVTAHVRQPVRRSRRPALAWLRWRPLLASAGALAAVAVAVIAVLALPSGGAGGGARVIRAEVTAPRASASLRVSGGRAQLDISGMPQTSAQRVYEVWVKRAGAPQPTDALFTVTAAGDATVGVPGSLRGVTVVMVTAEPRGGSKVPTSAPVIVAHLS